MQSSTDLVDWARLSTNRISGGRFDYRNLSEAGLQYFYWHIRRLDWFLSGSSIAPRPNRFTASFRGLKSTATVMGSLQRDVLCHSDARSVAVLRERTPP